MNPEFGWNWGCIIWLNFRIKILEPLIAMILIWTWLKFHKQEIGNWVQCSDQTVKEFRENRINQGESQYTTKACNLSKRGCSCVFILFYLIPVKNFIKQRKITHISCTFPRQTEEVMTCKRHGLAVNGLICKEGRPHHFEDQIQISNWVLWTL